MTPSEHDIIIVGSGPAGASTALHLAKWAPELARRTLILERARHPRPKLCGGGVSPDGEYILRRLGLDYTQVSHVPVEEAFFNFRGRGGFCLKLKPASFRVFQRDALDAWLFEAACARGVAARQETQVLDVRSVGDAMEVRTESGTYRARAVVGADGANSIARRAASKEPARRVARLLEFFVPPDSQQPEGPEKPQAFFDFSVSDRDVQGYVWTFPIRSGGSLAWNRGIYDARVRPELPYGRLKPTLRDSLTREGLHLDDYKLQGHPIRWFDPKGTFSAPGLLFVGDAAGVDPTFGEGISFSLGYGELAALELRKAFESGDFSFAGYRDRILASRMGRSLKRRIRMARLLYGMSHRRQQFVWWRFGPMMLWYINTFLLHWAKGRPLLS